MSFLKRIPVPVSALALGVAALGNVLAPYSASLRSACGIIASLLAALVVLRLLLDFKGVASECANCATLAVLPTLFMALMVLSTYLKPYASSAAFVLWASALGSQLVLTLVFVRRHLLSFELGRVLPSWFVVFVGYVVASVTSPAFSMQPIGRVLLYAGLACYAGILGVVLYRLVKLGPVPQPALPTLAIFAAPASLCLAGYLAVVEPKQVAIVYALLAVESVSLVFVLASLPKILRQGFHPGFAAITFPLVITALALRQSDAFLSATGGSAIPATVLLAVDVLATLAVAYVVVRYAIVLATPKVTVVSELK